MITAVGIIDSRIRPPADGCEELVCMVAQVRARRLALARASSPVLAAEAAACCAGLRVCLGAGWWETATPVQVRVAYAQVRSWDRICPAMARWADALEDLAEFYHGVRLDREWDRAMVSADLPWRCEPAVVPVGVELHLDAQLLAA